MRMKSTKLGQGNLFIRYRRTAELQHLVLRNKSSGWQKKEKAASDFDGNRHSQDYGIHHLDDLLGGTVTLLIMVSYSGGEHRTGAAKLYGLIVAGEPWFSSSPFHGRRILNGSVLKGLGMVGFGDDSAGTAEEDLLDGKDVM
ncbi:hypothetical protein ACJZ2D_002153 [Fusarium nematophilum]